MIIEVYCSTCTRCLPASLGDVGIDVEPCSFCLEEREEEAASLGFSEGYEAGKIDGYDEGYEDGLEEGSEKVAWGE